MTLYEDLEWRGLIKDVAGEDIKDKLNGEPITFYWGTDPTADSLHIGHYSSLVTAKRLMKAGHHPILLCGGATGRIGDPRPTAEREILDYKVIEKNIIGIRSQIERLFEGKAELVDNYDWTKEYTFLEFLRDIGKYINVNYMINKDIISRRLETGITYAEFSYTLLQGYDFLHLYQTKNCIMQVEGSDQWGNITTGIELIKKKLGKEAYAFTMPLILDANGNKFGKSEGNALWLDKNKTTPYQIYQYLINADDSKVLEYLKVFTFLSKEEIEEVYRKHEEQRELRLAQKTLAFEVVKDIHGVDEANKAIAMTEALFKEEFTNLTKNDIEEIFNTNEVSTITSTNLVDLIIELGAAKSKREAREFISGGAIKVNGEKNTSLDYTLEDKDFIDNTYIIIKRGKKNYYVGKRN